VCDVEAGVDDGHRAAGPGESARSRRSRRATIPTARADPSPASSRSSSRADAPAVPLRPRPRRAASLPLTCSCARSGAPGRARCRLPAVQLAASVLQLDEVGPCGAAPPTRSAVTMSRRRTKALSVSRVTTLRHMVLALRRPRLEPRRSRRHAQSGHRPSQASPETKVLRVSTLRRTDPVGYVDQPRFLNGVVELETGLSRARLLGALLERRADLRPRSRTRPPSGPRRSTSNLLLYGRSRSTSRAGGSAPVAARAALRARAAGRAEPRARSAWKGVG
jgi:hypothetical protein